MADDVEATLPKAGVQVSSDGVKLGWNVAAILATIGLGLYVSTIVTPIKTELEQLRQAQHDQGDTLEAVRTLQTEHFKTSAVIHTELLKEDGLIHEKLKSAERRIRQLERQDQNNDPTLP